MKKKKDKEIIRNDKAERKDKEKKECEKENGIELMCERDNDMCGDNEKKKNNEIRMHRKKGSIYSKSIEIVVSQACDNCKFSLSLSLLLSHTHSLFCSFFFLALSPFHLNAKVGRRAVRVRVIVAFRVRHRQLPHHSAAIGLLLARLRRLDLRNRISFFRKLGFPVFFTTFTQIFF